MALAGARRLGDAVREAGPQTGVWTWAADSVSDLLLMFSTLPRIDDFPAWPSCALDLLLVVSRRARRTALQLEASADRQLLAHWLEHSRLEPA